jgi:hypothetical protein
MTCDFEPTSLGSYLAAAVQTQGRSPTTTHNGERAAACCFTHSQWSVGGLSHACWIEQLARPVIFLRPPLVPLPVTPRPAAALLVCATLAGPLGAGCCSLPLRDNNSLTMARHLASVVSAAAVVLACTARAVVATTTGFACAHDSSIYSCLCASSNAEYTSTLCGYFNQAANATHVATKFGLITIVQNVSAAYTLFAVNNSAYAALTSAERTFYESVLDDSLNYLAVNQSYNLTTLSAKTNLNLNTVASQSILVTTAKNVTVLNDDDSCVVKTCSPTGPGPYGSGSVCLVECLLAPTEGLGTIAIIGIVVAGIAAVCLIVACLFNIFRKDSTAGEDEGTYNAVDNGGE